MITSDQLKDVLERADALHRYLEIDKKKIKTDTDINCLGTTNVKINLDKEVQATLKIQLYK